MIKLLKRIFSAPEPEETVYLTYEQAKLQCDNAYKVYGDTWMICMFEQECGKFQVCIKPNLCHEGFRKLSDLTVAEFKALMAGDMVNEGNK